MPFEGRETTARHPPEENDIMTSRNTIALFATVLGTCALADSALAAGTPGLVYATPQSPAARTITCPCSISPNGCEIIEVIFTVHRRVLATTDPVVIDDSGRMFLVNPDVTHSTGPSSDGYYNFGSGPVLTSGELYWVWIKVRFRSTPGGAIKEVEWKYDPTNGQLVITCQ